MTSATDRKNHLVWDQLELGAYKQALQLCNRRIKKGEKSEMLLALKAYVLTHLSSPTTTEEATQIARALSERSPPPLAIDILRLLTRVWGSLGQPEEVTKIWERAVKAQPQNEDLAKEWFWGMIRTLDWRGAQKAAMNLQKTYTKRREYWFWAVVASLLLHNSLPEGSPERKLFGTLAYRMIDKARSDTPVDTTVIPPRAIQNSQEVSFMMELLTYVVPADANKAALAILNSKNLGVDSQIGSGDWWGLARKRLDLLETTQDWKSLYSTCRDLLLRHEGNGVEAIDKTGEQQSTVEHGRGDDWRVWDGFVLAAGKLYDAGDKVVSKESLDKIIAHKKAARAGSSRHADLALVKFSSLFHDKRDGPEGTPTLLEAAEEYFGKTGNKNCCFEDLQCYIEMLEDSERKDFLKYVEAAVEKMPEGDEKEMIDKTTCSINNQKFVYLLTVSPLSSTSTSVEATNTINAFITATLKIYSSSIALGATLLITDNQYGDDAALLSVMGLVRLYNMRPTDQAPLYQSIQVLETLLQKSKHNYQALLLLVRIYLLIGAISSAFEVYHRLNIKQIQNDTLSHYLLTRISTLLPNDARTATFLRDAGGIYESSRTQTPNMLQLAFERGGYAQMMGFLEFSDRVAGSICRSMWEVELHRLSRLSPGYPNPGPITEVGYKSTVWDSRDFTVIIDCELSSVGPFEKSFRLGPTPAENWVRGFAAAEEIVHFLSSNITTPKDSNGTATGTVEKPTISPNAAGRIAKALKAGEGEFTATEKTYLLLLGAVADLATAAVKKDSENVSKALQGITSDSLPAVLSSLSEAPGWGLLHALWLQKDACVVAELAGKFVSSLKGLKPKPAVAELNDKIKAGGLRISKAAEETQKKVEDDEATQVLIDAVLAEEGVGVLFRRDGEVFGGVEKVAENVTKTRGAVGRSFEAAI